VGWAAAGRGVSLVLLEGVRGEGEGGGRGGRIWAMYTWWLYMRPWPFYMRTPCFDDLGYDSEYVAMYGGCMGCTAHMRMQLCGVWAKKPINHKRYKP
jgi:hypothetical protein